MESPNRRYIDESSRIATTRADHGDCRTAAHGPWCREFTGREVPAAAATDSENTSGLGIV
jgi:hypothetical protein